MNTTTTKHMTPAEVQADYNKNQRRQDELKAAAKVMKARAEVLTSIHGTDDRAAVLAKIINTDRKHAAEVLESLYNETNRFIIPDWIYNAYELNTMKRRRCSFGVAVQIVAATRARIEARRKN
jgi:predicted metal-dependent hydrolase